MNDMIERLRRIGLKKDVSYEAYMTMNEGADYLKILNLDTTQLTKVNKYREKANVAPI